jgi:Tfp pilus assembly protein PilX
MNTRFVPKRARQRGMTLMMALIMLVVLTLLALTSFNLGKSNMQIVSNMQHRDESVAAAREVIEATISDTKFFEQPEAVLARPCGAPNSTCVDTDGDGSDDVRVTLTPQPTCVKVKPIKQETLALNEQDDRNCAQGEKQDFGVAGATTGDSMCSNSVWDIHALATDLRDNSSIEVVEGVAVRVPSDDTTTACPVR